MMKIAPILIIVTMLIGCSEPGSEVEDLNKESQEQLKRSFLTANDVVNRSNDILQNDIENLLGSFERKLVTLISIGGTDEVF
jgi:hypothetical protein